MNLVHWVVRVTMEKKTGAFQLEVGSAPILSLSLFLLVIKFQQMT